jgi:hypothetical protein
VTIKSKQAFSAVDVFNSNGTKMYHATPNKMQAQIDLSTFGPGTYYIQTHTGSKIVTNKVVLIK